jgi:hypothetical protein
MSTASRFLYLIAALALVACSDDRVTKIPPDLAIELQQIDFGIVRVGQPSDFELKLGSESRTAVSILGASIEYAAGSAGGARAFTVLTAPESIEGQGEATLTLRFQPTSAVEYQATLLVSSDDPEEPEIRLKLFGRGGLPSARVFPECQPPCTDFAVTEEPPAIDFGERPALRTDPLGNIVNEPVWPSVIVESAGEMPLRLLRIAIEGDEAFRSRQSLDVSGVSIDPLSAQRLEVVFDPQIPKAEYHADLLVVTDDPVNPEIRVRLDGKLKANQPPQACAAIVEVRQPDGSIDVPHDNQGQPSFGASVQVQPGERGLVLLSAFSDHFVPGLHPEEQSRGDASLCTTDPEDGRLPLAFAWTVVQRPAGSSAEVIGPSMPEPAFRPDAIGSYLLRLTVTDPQGASASADVAFDAIPERDLAVELSWEGQPNVDLDVHLVKPGPCGDSPDCLFTPRGDINGYSWSRATDGLDWGEAGQSYDDPRLDFDDQGDGALIENVSLNRPEDDPACATSPCTYDVYVHYFKDWRAASQTAPECPGLPCLEADSCGCAETSAGAGSVCVAGRCVLPARPTVKVFVRPTPSNPAPVLTVPLAPDQVTIGGPCFLWHVARITWPSREELIANPQAPVTVNGVGHAGARSFLYYGTLGPRSFSCAPNTPPGTPEADVTYVSGAVPSYE